MSNDECKANLKFRYQFFFSRFLSYCFDYQIVCVCELTKLRISKPFKLIIAIFFCVLSSDPSGHLAPSIPIHTDNSNSVANLVENENPTSIQSVPNDDTLPNPDTDNLDNLAFADMKGSYNNLFCDNLDDEPLQKSATDQCNRSMQPHEHLSVTATLPSGLLENVYCNVSPMQQQQTHYTRPANHLTDSTINLNSVASTFVDDILTSSDPNLHVYSNITNGGQALSTQPTKQPPKVSDIFTIDTTNNTSNTKSMSANNEIIEFTNNIGSILSQSMAQQSSAMLSENLADLDLDDPTLVGGSITAPPSSMANIMSDALNNSSSEMAIATDLITGQRNNKSFSSIDDIRLHLPKNMFGTDKSNASADTTADITDANHSVLDSQHLRSLQDTTMIDCALDLDSLEDTTTVINSQSKTKWIVTFETVSCVHCKQCKTTEKKMID